MLKNKINLLKMAIAIFQILGFMHFVRDVRDNFKCIYI